jgi:nucleobase:cation symporter-1, NCS1 family
VAAWIGGTAFVVHGIGGNLDLASVSQASKNMYKLGFLLSFFMGGVLFYAFNLVWPAPLYPDTRAQEGSNTFEFMADHEGFFPDEDAHIINREFALEPPQYI